jgi:hypothetical protein
VNFGGVNNSYYTRGEHDYLYDKVVALMDKFYYLSHTWDHPCTFDTLSVAAGLTTMSSEISQNKAFAPAFFGDKMSLWSNFSMITPCVSGLYNAGVLQALNNNGITACVSDESVSKGVDYEPITPYHGVYSDVATNGYVGVYFVPREALDIDYCAMTPADVVDEYNTQNVSKKKSFPTPSRNCSLFFEYTQPKAQLQFEPLMALQRMYAIQDKIGFRNDPFMMHQTNAATFLYNDPTPDARFAFGSSYNTSLIALFMQRVAGDLMLYYNLPSMFAFYISFPFLHSRCSSLSLLPFSNLIDFFLVMAVQMDNLVNMFQQRQTMDGCGITATLGVNANHQIVDLSVTSQGTCQMSLSGGAVLTGTFPLPFSPSPPPPSLLC